MTVVHILRLDRHAETLIVKADPLGHSTASYKAKTREARISPQSSKETSGCPFELYVNLFFIIVLFPGQVLF